MKGGWCAGQTSGHIREPSHVESPQAGFSRGRRFVYFRRSSIRTATWSNTNESQRTSTSAPQTSSLNPHVLRRSLRPVIHLNHLRQPCCSACGDVPSCPSSKRRRRSTSNIERYSDSSQDPESRDRSYNRPHCVSVFGAWSLEQFSTSLPGLFIQRLAPSTISPLLSTARQAAPGALSARPNADAEARAILNDILIPLKIRNLETDPIIGLIASVCLVLGVSNSFRRHCRDCSFNVWPHRPYHHFSLLLDRQLQAHCQIDPRARQAAPGALSDRPSCLSGCPAGQ